MKNRTISYAILIAALLLLSQPLLAGERGRCVRLDFDTPVTLPDGSVHDNGTLRVCLERDLTPVSGLHAIYVDNVPIGYFSSQAFAPEDATPRPAAVAFERSADATRLIGYTVSNGRSVEAYRLRPEARARARRVVAVDSLLATGSESRDPTPWIWVAAQR